MPELLIDRVIRIIAATQHIPIESIQPASTFEELKIDSLDAINILFGLENEFDISIDDEQARGLVSVQDLADRLSKMIDAGGEAGAPVRK
jgi:acyl carrier protein